MLLDDLMPRYDVAERHVTLVRATTHATYASIRGADLSGGTVTRVLLGLRMMPAALLAVRQSPQAALAELRERRAHRGARLADFERAGFRVVAERYPEELVIGLLGRFWTPRGGLNPEVTADTFHAPPPPGQALAGWNFTVHPRPGGHCELRTETRVRCAPDVRLKFRLYWLVVRPGSGLIRRSMLRAIRQKAEQAAPLESPADMGELAWRHVFSNNDVSAQEHNMDLGTFSVSLAVKDLEVSRAFYEKFGFTAFAGDASQHWLIMRNGSVVIGLFQGMFEKNILTFNPGWDGNAQKVASFTDVRELQRQLQAKGVQLEHQADESTTGPASLIAVDPDGNPILIDQHV